MAATISGPAFVVVQLMFITLCGLTDADMAGDYDFARYRKVCREEVTTRRIKQLYLHYCRFERCFFGVVRRC